MPPDSKKTFHCVMIAPMGKLLDCQTSSVVFPAHDGQVGVWYNHIPMLCNLGLGIMEVKGVSSDSEILPRSTFSFIEGGIALISRNLLTIIASDAICMSSADAAENIEKIIATTKKKLGIDVYPADRRKRERPTPAAPYTAEQRSRDIQKISLLTKLTQQTSASPTK